MKNSLRFIRRLGNVLMLFALIACAKNTADKLVGRWVIPGEDFSLKFMADGSFVGSQYQGSQVVKGFWKLSEDGKTIVTESNGVQKPNTIRFLSSDSLVLDTGSDILYLKSGEAK